MKLKRCDYGHYYDPSKFAECPHCDTRDKQDVTMALYDEPVAAPVPAPQAPAFEAPAACPDDEQATVAMYAKAVDAAVKPPVGYLICLKGASRGRDYKLYAQRNTLGRSDSMDVAIKGDVGISRENNATISYDPRSRVYHLIAGEGKSIVYVNGEEVLTPVKLFPKDKIEIGDTMLVFLPLCGPEFDWDE